VIGTPNRYPKLLVFDHSSESFSVADAVAMGDDGRIVQPTGLLPQSELSGADVLRHALTRLPDHGQFKVMNRAGSVQCEMLQQSPLHEVDQQRAVSGSKHVCAADEHHRATVLLRFDNPLGEDRQRVMLERHARSGRRDLDFVALKIVDAVHQRKNFQAAAVELGEGHCGSRGWI
jgi:hypothetical protein